MIILFPLFLNLPHWIFSSGVRITLRIHFSWHRCVLCASPNHHDRPYKAWSSSLCTLLPDNQPCTTRMPVQWSSARSHSNTENACSSPSQGMEVSAFLCAMLSCVRYRPYVGLIPHPGRPTKRLTEGFESYKFVIRARLQEPWRR